MNKQIDFSNLGGYPFAQEDLDWLQKSYTGALGAVAHLAGSMVVLQGCTIEGGNIGNGWLSINGELLPFIGGAIGSGSFNVVTTPTSLVFEDGSSKPVLIEKACVLQTPGAFSVENLVRVGTIGSLYTAFQNFLTDFLTSDDPSYIHPLGKRVLATTVATKAILDNNFILHRGTFDIGDPATDQLYTVNHGQNIDGAYYPYCILISMGANHANDNDISFVARNIQANSFQVSIREYVATAQNLKMAYFLLKY